MKAALGAALLLFVFGASLAAEGRPRVVAGKSRGKKAAKKGADPARWFATRPGLIRVYERRRATTSDDGNKADLAGASCEVVESVPAAEGSSAQTGELCTMIVGKKPTPATRLTYQLRQAGIFLVKAETGGKASAVERMLLPGGLRVGTRWVEAGAVKKERRVKTLGSRCKVERREFGDCLVVAVVSGKGRTAVKTTEKYAAGVGLVEDSQWRLVDVQGL